MTGRRQPPGFSADLFDILVKNPAPKVKILRKAKGFPFETSKDCERFYWKKGQSIPIIHLRRTFGGISMEKVQSVRRSYTDLSGREHELEYILWNADGGYGIAIEDAGGYGDRIWNLTTRRDRAEEIYALLVRHLVTPISLRDVLEDLL